MFDVYYYKRKEGTEGRLLYEEKVAHFENIVIYAGTYKILYKIIFFIVQSCKDVTIKYVT